MVGNLNNVAMITWTPEEMEQHVQEAIAAAAAGGGYILSAQGPEIPWDVPDEVIAAMVRGSEKYGRYSTSTK